MPTITPALTPAERSALRAQAHALDPVVIIGDAGLSAGVLKEIDANLDAHALIKVRVLGDDREQRIAIYESICEKMRAAPVQHIGKLLVLYRPQPKDGAKTAGADIDPKLEAKRVRGKGTRTVTIVKPSPSGTRRPTVTKVLLKGNERVTAGGLVKRAKPRQASRKKSSLG